jgi:hypothetical protein
MHRVTASISLIAYLMGGWFLPALHQHGASCRHADLRACESKDHSYLHFATHDKYGGCCCSQDAKHQAASDVVHTPRSAEKNSAVSGHEAHGCVGLCARCVARALTTTPTNHAQVLGIFDVVVGIQCVHDVSLDLDSPEGCRSPRGPPENLV